jgi:short subunit dehydrogenase-like uncharacterized protein
MLMIYGATGYTGRLVLTEAIRQGHRPVLAGRSANTETLAQTLGLVARRAALDDAPGLAQSLDGVQVLLNCAGPFSQSGPPLMAACLASGTTYLDLAGEVAEHLAALALNDDAKTAGVTLMPGVGFGVVPTDCAALLATQALPGAEALTIAYETRGDASRGTLQTVLPMLHNSGWRRVAGKLLPAQPGQESRVFQDGPRSVEVLTNPWRADLVTAGYSTGVAAIDTFSTFPEAARLLMQIGGTEDGRAMVIQALNSAPDGPSEASRAAGGTTIWAEARRGSERKLVTMRGPEAYDFTARCAVLCATLALQSPPPPGFQTPGTAFGADFILAVKGVDII